MLVESSMAAGDSWSIVAVAVIGVLVLLPAVSVKFTL